MNNLWDIKKALREFELDDGATFEEVKKARYELIQFWHPDAFHNDPKRYKKALGKSQKINSAFDFLSGISTNPSYSFFIYRKPNIPEPSETPHYNDISTKESKKGDVSIKPSATKNSIFTNFAQLSSTKKSSLILVVSIFLIACSIGSEELIRQGLNKTEGVIFKIGTKWDKYAKVGSSSMKIPGCEYYYSYLVDNVEHRQKTETKGSSLCPSEGQRKTIWYSKNDYSKSYTSLSDASGNIFSAVTGFIGLFGAFGSLFWLFVIFILNLRKEDSNLLKIKKQKIKSLVVRIIPATTILIVSLYFVFYKTKGSSTPTIQEIMSNPASYEKDDNILEFIGVGQAIVEQAKNQNIEDKGLLALKDAYDEEVPVDKKAKAEKYYNFLRNQLIK